MKNGIAFFDMDGTITKKDTFMDFIIYARGRFAFLYGIIKLCPYVFFYLLKIFPNHKIKEKFFQTFLIKYTQKELNKLGDAYSQYQLPKIFFNEAIERIKWHQLNGHRIIILTASSPIWLSHWCNSNNLELKGTQFEVVNGKYTGKLSGNNCYGIEKLKIVNEILSENPNVTTYGYGNTRSDQLFLNQLKNKYYKQFKK